VDLIHFDGIKNGGIADTVKNTVKGAGIQCDWVIPIEAVQKQTTPRLRGCLMLPDIRMVRRRESNSSWLALLQAVSQKTK
jgi:hypothetical protein